ncbi:MAG: hypothetical protein OXT09_14555 [Myxococcales bacterium]|nr:hypothetical protein [Myxococcales bacterium]
MVGIRAAAWIAAVGLALALARTPALAYSTPDAYAERPSAGGGGGRWFTGSPAEGYGCSVCHSSEATQRQYPLYVAGLPLDGYALATTQEVVLSWPEFAAAWSTLRRDPTMPPPPSQPTPAVGMIAELVAESGKGSGIIEIDADNASPLELCEMTRPNLKPRLGVQLYQVRAGLEPLRVKADSTGMLRCEAHQLGQRCIVALNSCGAHEVRIRWTTPDNWQGPIWFSAGFVATEALSGSFDRDSVDEITIPLLPQNDDGKYQRVLRSGCALQPAGSTGALAHLAPAAIATLLVYRRRRRHGRAP